MKKRRVSNLLALAVLSLLTERPMHPYEISAVMRQRGMSENIKLNYGSLYSVIDALLREGFIVSLETQREGRHPERTVYATTEAGHTEFFDWLRSLISTPAKEYSQFTAGLSFIAHLSPSEAITLLEDRVHHLEKLISSKHTTVEADLRQGLDRLFIIEDEYDLALLETSVTWIQKIICEIKDGTLTQTSDQQMVWRVMKPDIGFKSEDEMATYNNPESDFTNKG